MAVPQGNVHVTGPFGPTSWDAASATCEAQGQKLLSVDSEEEEDALKLLIPNTTRWGGAGRLSAGGAGRGGVRQGGAERGRTGQGGIGQGGAGPGEAGRSRVGRGGAGLGRSG